MKKVTISFYTNSDDIEEVIDDFKKQELTRKFKTLDYLYSTKIEEDNKLNFTYNKNLVAYLEDRSSFRYYAFKSNVVLEIIERDKNWDELKRLCESIEKPDLINNLNEYVVIRRYALRSTVEIELGYTLDRQVKIANINNEEELLKLNRSQNCCDFKDCFKSVSLKPISNNGLYLAITNNLDPKRFLLFSKEQKANVIALYLHNKLCTPEELEDEKIKDLLYNKICKIVNKLTSPKSYSHTEYKVLFNTLGILLFSIYKKEAGQELSEYEEKRVKHFNSKQLLYLYKIMAKNVDTKKFINYFSIFLTNYDGFSKELYKLSFDVLKLTDYLTKKEKEILSNTEFNNDYEKLRHQLTLLKIHSLQKSMGRESRADDSETKYNATSFINKFNNIMIMDNNLTFNNLTDEQYQEIKEIIKSSFSQFFIIKESRIIISNIYTELFEMYPKLFEFLKEVILECLEEAPGRSHITIRSLCKNNIVLNNSHILTTVDPKYRKLRQYILEQKLK